MLIPIFGGSFRLSNVSVGASCCESGIMCNEKIIEPMMMNVRGDYSGIISQVYVHKIVYFRTGSQKSITKLNYIGALQNV